MNKVYEVVRNVDGHQISQGFFESIASANDRRAECVAHSETEQFKESARRLGIKYVFHGVVEHEVKP